MATKTVDEIEKLKVQWKSDPCWDIEKTEGFEEHKEELRAYRNKCEFEWEQEQIEREKHIDEQAESLGIKGIYRLLKQQERLIERHTKAIEALADGECHLAYRILQGYED